MNKKIFLLMFCMILLVTTITAHVPFEENINTGTGLQIFETKQEAIQYNTTFYPHFHLGNISNGMPLSNTVADCYIHLYNSTGNHIYQSGALEKDANGWDYEDTILYGNFTEFGEHNTFTIFCNATALGLGGTAKGTYEITGSGWVRPEGIVILGFSLMLILLLMFITVFIIKAIGTIVEGNFDLLDIGYAWGLYFGLLGFNQLTGIYLGSQIVMDWTNLAVTVLGFPMILVPVFAFFLSLFRADKKRKEEAKRW